MNIINLKSFEENRCVFTHYKNNPDDEYILTNAGLLIVNNGCYSLYDQATSYLKRAIEIDPDNMVAWIEPGTASPLERAAVAAGRDIGASGVFVPEADGTALTFERTEAGFVDDQTGSVWNVVGRATDGPLSGAQLESVAHLDTFWFAWSTFQPDSDVSGDRA